MYSAANRTNTLFSYASYVLFILLMLNTFTGYFYPLEPEIDLKLHKTYQLGKHLGNDKLEMTFDLEADFTSLFNWNTKQLFLYLSVEYVTDKKILNQLVLWDKIIEKDDTDLFKMKLIDQKTKYPFIDQGTNLKNATIDLILNYNIIPVTGQLSRHFGGKSTFVIPEKYFN